MSLLICLLYIAAHAGLYFAVLRGWPKLGSERGIFLYHFVSAILVTGGFGVWAIAHGGSDAWAWFVCVVMLHGIYSLSFLELWALADDSYSLAIMEIIDRGGAAAGPALTQRLAGSFTATEELTRQGREIHEATQELLARAKAAGALRADVEVGDLSMLIEQLQSIRIGDPLRANQLRHRYLTVMLDGLHLADAPQLPGTPPTWQETSGRY